MDTVLVQRPQLEKTATSAAGLGIALCLLLTQNLWISAKDISGITGISPTITNLAEKQKIEEEKFEAEILDKYRNLHIEEVCKGIKHVKTIKYYNGKPVRISLHRPYI